MQTTLCLEWKRHLQKLCNVISYTEKNLSSKLHISFSWIWIFYFDLRRLAIGSRNGIEKKEFTYLLNSVTVWYKQDTFALIWSRFRSLQTTCCMKSVRGIGLHLLGFTSCFLGNLLRIVLSKALVKVIKWYTILLSVQGYPSHTEKYITSIAVFWKKKKKKKKKVTDTHCFSLFLLFL